MFTVKFLQNVEDQHKIPHREISISFKYFLTSGEDAIVDCDTPEMKHCVWELCCQGSPAPIWPIKHLSCVQIFFLVIIASSDN